MTQRYDHSSSEEYYPLHYSNRNTPSAYAATSQAIWNERRQFHHLDSRTSRVLLPHLDAETTTMQYHPLHHQPALLHDSQYYLSCYLAGGLSSSIRWILSPLELIKTRLQTSHTFAPSAASVTAPLNNTMVGTFANIYANEGATGLFRGLGPTAAAYWLQTSTKYSLYEMIKDRLSESHNVGWSSGLVYVASAATAEAIADILMCPFEMLKVKIQTNAANMNNVNQQRPFPNRFGPALQEMIRHRKLYNFPFGSLGPVWGRQIPGTIVNFCTFENAVSMIYSGLGSQNKSDYSPTQQLGVTVLAGYIAGVCCAVVSHPADSIISLKSLPEYHGHSAVQIIRRVGWYRLATKGLAPRILMTGQIIAFQWLLYDSIKSVFGYGTSGGMKLSLAQLDD
jgi:solute carrier family 25 (mitochondrial phosphate transporter), member 3